MHRSTITIHLATSKIIYAIIKPSTRRSTIIIHITTRQYVRAINKSATRISAVSIYAAVNKRVRSVIKSTASRSSIPIHFTARQRVHAIKKSTTSKTNAISIYISICQSVRAKVKPATHISTVFSNYRIYYYNFRYSILGLANSSSIICLITTDYHSIQR